MSALLRCALITCFAGVGCYPFGARLGEFHAHCTPLGLRPLDGHGGDRDEHSVMYHAIFVTSEGHPLEPHDDRCASQLDSAHYARYLHAMMDSIRADSARRHAAPKVLVRVHGGLNTLNGSLAATVAMTRRIDADTASGFYPIFVNWESGLLSAYGEHAVALRRGHRSSFHGLEILDPVATPLYVVADVGSAVARLPLTIEKQFLMVARPVLTNKQPELRPPEPPTVASAQREAGIPPQPSDPDVDTTGTSASQRPRIATEETQLFAAYVRAQKKQMGQIARHGVQVDSMARGSPIPHGDAIAVSRFAYRRTVREAILHIGASAVLSLVPTRYFISPPRKSLQSFHHSYRSTSNSLVRFWRVLGWIPPKTLALATVDGVGTPAWSAMHRRASLMMRTEEGIRQRGDQVNEYRRPDGALAGLVDSLASLTRSGPGWHVTLLGHSMGAIVGTEVLRHPTRLPIDNVVFMASAASIREVEQSVFPYMLADTTVQFYNLTLHPWADQRERNFLVPPYGSLLAWIDAYFGYVETETDRMSGKYDNLLRTAMLVPPSIRGRMHIKAFGYRSGTGCGEHDYPYKHGHFNDPSVIFWRERFWHPGEPGCKTFEANIKAGKY